MSDFTIFIAGSTNSQMKDNIKTAIESRYCKEGIFKHGYSIVCKDCNSPGLNGKQVKYNQVITNEASLFLLVIDKLPIGVYSMEELMRACICNEANKANNKERPDIYIFASSTIEGKDQIIDLQNVYSSITERYITFYKNEEDFLRKFDTALGESMKNKQKEDEDDNEKQKENDKKKKKDRLFKFLKHSCIVILIVTVLILILSLLRKDEPIFFAGGGTVKQFLSNHNMDIDKRQDGIYIHIPTGDSWVMLGEEYKVGDKMKKKYYPIILAADSISKNLGKLGINDIKDYRTKIGHIAELSLGKDSLFVYISNEKDSNKNPLLRFISDNSLSHGEITAHELYSILHNFYGKDSVMVYHTSSGSGTVAAYCKAMIESDSIAKKEQWCWEMDEKLKGHAQFDSYNTQMSQVRESPFIVLGSKSYNIMNIDSPNSRAIRLRFVNNQRETLEKPLFLYFVMKKIEGRNDMFYIEKPIRRFLKELVKKGNIEELKDIKIKNEYTNVDTSLVIPFN